MAGKDGEFHNFRQVWGMRYFTRSGWAWHLKEKRERDEAKRKV